MLNGKSVECKKDKPATLPDVAGDNEPQGMFWMGSELYYTFGGLSYPSVSGEQLDHPEDWVIVFGKDKQGKWVKKEDICQKQASRLHLPDIGAAKAGSILVCDGDGWCDWVKKEDIYGKGGGK